MVGHADLGKSSSIHRPASVLADSRLCRSSTTSSPARITARPSKSASSLRLSLHRPFPPTLQDRPTRKKRHHQSTSAGPFRSRSSTLSLRRHPHLRTRLLPTIPYLHSPRHLPSPSSPTSTSTFRHLPSTTIRGRGCSLPSSPRASPRRSRTILHRFSVVVAPPSSRRRVRSPR